MKTLLVLLASTTLVLAGGLREKRQSYYGRGGNSYSGNSYAQGRADVQVVTTNIYNEPHQALASPLVLNG